MSRSSGTPSRYPLRGREQEQGEQEQGDQEVQEEQVEQEQEVVMAPPVQDPQMERLIQAMLAQAEIKKSLQDCPKMLKSEKLETWMEEVKLWDSAFPGQESQKYLKFRDMVKNSETCPDLQKFVQTKIADNESFNKSEPDVIKRILTEVQNGLVKSDLVKSTEAWTKFVTIKQAESETPKDFVNRFESVVTSLENAKMNQEPKALAIHLLRSSNFTQASKENIVAKLDTNVQSKEMYEFIAKRMKEIKTLTANDAEVKLSSTETEQNKESVKTAFFVQKKNRNSSREYNRSSSREYNKRREFSGNRGWRDDRGWRDNRGWQDGRERTDGRYQDDGRSRKDWSERRDGNQREGNGIRRRDDGSKREGSSRRDEKDNKENGKDERFRNEGGNRKERSTSRSGGRHKSGKPWKENRSYYTSEVIEVLYTPYNDNLELIKNVIEEEVKPNDDNFESKKDLIELVYKEGNIDIDPCVAIVDTGCPKTVAGRRWMNSYLNSVGKDFKSLVHLERKFRFGNGPVYTSNVAYKIQVDIGKLKTEILVSLVDADIPLLLGLDYQRKWGIVLDVQDETLRIKYTGETFKIKSSRSNHWKLRIQNNSIHNEATNLVLNVNLEDMDDNKLKKHILKVHKNLGHKSEHQLLQLVKMAEQDSKKVKETIKDVVKECETCKRFPKTPPTPKVAMSKATTNNEVVSLDLKEFRNDNKHVLYACDEFSGYMKGKVIKDKKPSTIVTAFNNIWIEEGPGIPRKGTMTDNGGEFKNPEFKEMAAKFGLKISLTAGNSPWSNGKCERNHAVCDRTIQKLREEDPQMSLEDALSAALYVHNLQVNKTGFSPRQITFGYQGVVPGIFDGTPATMEPVVESDKFRNIFIKRQEAENLYRKIDSNERLQKAITQQTYGYQDEHYEPGELVLFKEEQTNRWSGPAKVTGVEGNKVRVIHSGYDRTIPKCRVQPYESKRFKVDEEKDQTKLESEAENENENKSDKETDVDVEENKIEIRPKRNQEVEYLSNGNQSRGKVIKVGKSSGKDKFRCWIKKEDGTIENLDFSMDVRSWKVLRKVQFDKSTEHLERLRDDPDISDVTLAYEDRNHIEAHQVKRNDVTLAYEDRNQIKAHKENDHLGVYFLTNFGEIDKERFEDENEIMESFPVLIPAKHHDHPDIVKAKKDELEKWKKYEAYVEVNESEATNPITTRWVITDKGDTEKARLCVRGFEEEIYPRSDSPTASNEAMKLFLAICANESLKMKSLDVTSAFLQGEKLERDVYVIPPKEVRQPGKLWKLQKSAYGLYDASRKWFLAVKTELLEMGMKPVSGDDAFFTMVKNGRLLGSCILHVDDFLVGSGSEEFDRLLNSRLKGRFTFGRIESGQFKFTGLKIEQKKDKILVDQIEFIQSLNEIAVKRIGPKDEKLNTEELKDFRKLTGQLSWAAQNTRPDLSFDVRDLATRSKSATLQDIKLANKVLKKAQQTDIKIKYRRLGNWKSLKIVGYSDSSYKNDENATKSVAGRILFLTSADGKCCPLAWKSKTIQQVCKSVKSAETRSLDLGMEDGIFQAQMFNEAMTGKAGGQIPVQMKIDSKTLYDSLKSTKQVEEKTIRHLIAWQKQQIEAKTIEKVDWVCSEEQIADVFTKKGVKSYSIIKTVTNGNFPLNEL